MYNYNRIVAFSLKCYTVSGAQLRREEGTMNRNEVNSSATVEDITNSFFKLFAATDINRVRIEDVCAKCHVSRTTFYRYFNDKYDVLDKKEEQLLKGTEDFCNAPDLVYRDEKGVIRPSPRLIEILSFISDNMLYYRAILASDLARRFMVKWSEQINTGFRLLLDSSGVGNTELMLRTVSGGFLAGLSHWIEKEYSLSPAAVAELLAGMLSQVKLRNI